MSKALYQLMLMQLRGLLRRGLRQVRTPRGAIFFGFGILIFVSWLLPNLMNIQEGKPTIQSVRNVMPLILLGVTLLTTLTSAGEKAIAFTGGEVDLLFPGPFSRRELLIYKLLKGSFVSFMSALIVSIAIYRNASYWIACYIGCALSLVFVQFAGMVALLIGDAFGQRTRTLGKLILVGVILVLVALALKSSTGEGGFQDLMDDPRETLQRFGRTPAGRILLAPFYVLTRVVTAKPLLPDLLKWTPIAVAMNLVLVGLILMLDARFVEAAAGASERRYERLRRFRSGGVLAAGAVGAASSGGKARGSLRMLPRLRGAGTIAWRQLLHVRRSSRGLIFVLVMLAMVVGPPLIAASRANSRPADVMSPILLGLALISVMLASVLRFDFRADLDAMETLKALPIAPTAIAWGQIITPALVMTLLHWLVIAATYFATSSAHGSMAVSTPLAIATVIAPPFNLLMFAAENLIFLLAPTRPSGAGPDFSLLGKQIFTLIIRTIGVSVASIIATIVALVAYRLCSANEDVAMVVATAAAFVTLTAEAIAVMPVVGIAFRRFDPSVHMPA